MSGPIYSVMMINTINLAEMVIGQDRDIVKVLKAIPTYQFSISVVTTANLVA